MKPRTIVCHIFILLFAASISGQSFDKEKLDKFLNLLVEKNKAMGSLAIARNNDLLYAKATGFTVISPQQKVPSNTETRYRIGSISKIFTATLIFQLIEEGKINLTTTLDTYYPTVPNAKTITIGDLLNHRSGIHSFTDDSTYSSWETESRSHKEMIRIISAGKPEFEPGTKGAYSNANYVLLGYIIEKVTRKSYEEVLLERICSTIGLKNTYYGGKTQPGKNECYSFRYIDGWIQLPETDMSIPHGAGAIVSTPSDLVRFISSLFTGKLISENSLTKMKTITDGYGMGMFQYPFNGRTTYGHTGGIDGFASTLCYFPDDSLAIAYTSNGSTVKILDIFFGSLSIFYNLPFTLPVFTSYTVKPEDLGLYKGIYSSTQLPLKITITVNNGTLMGQATGQPVFPLEPVSRHVFKLEAAGIVLNFNPDRNELLLEQGGGKYLFTRNK